MLEARDFTVIVEVVEETKGQVTFNPLLAQVVDSGVNGLYYSDLIYIQPQRGIKLVHQDKTFLVLDEEYILAKYVGVDVDQDGNVVQPFELVTGDFDDISA